MANVRDVAAMCVAADVPVFGIDAPVEGSGEEERFVARPSAIDDGQPSLLPDLAPDPVG